MKKSAWIRMANRGNEKLEKIHVNHVDIFYEMVGQGRPVVLIHGNGEDILSSTEQSIFRGETHLLSSGFPWTRKEPMDR